MPMLNYPKLELNTAQETSAFRAIDQVIRQDPDCKRIFGRSIYSWKGDAFDDAEPSIDMCPWIRLTPVPIAGGWANVGQHKLPMNVKIELAAAGTNADNLMNLNGIVRAALFPQNAAQLALVRSIIDPFITQGELTTPSYGAVKDKEGNKLLYAVGGLELILYVNT